MTLRRTYLASRAIRLIVSAALCCAFVPFGAFAQEPTNQEANPATAEQALQESPTSDAPMAEGQIIVVLKEDAVASVLEEGEAVQGNAEQPGAAVTGADLTDGYLGVTEEGDPSCLAAESQDAEVLATISSEEATNQAIVLAETPEGMSVQEAIQALEANPDVAYAEPDYLYTLPENESADALEEAAEVESVEDGVAQFASAIAGVLSDERATYLYQLGERADTRFPDIKSGTTTNPSWGANVLEAWKNVTCEGNVTVAVIDTGCTLDHEDLDDNLDATYAKVFEHSPWYVNDKGKTTADETLEPSPLTGDSTSLESERKVGHGTHVCGIVAAEADNGIGVAGSSGNATVIPFDVFTPPKSETSSAEMAFSSDIIRALAYVYELKTGEETKDLPVIQNLHVVNMSLGNLPSYNQSFYDVLANLKDAGVLCVCAAGNNGSTSVSYPSDYENVLSVTWLDRDGTDDSGADYNLFKDISAPGDGILSTSYTGGYAFKDGSSMSAPCVSGIAALLWAKEPSLTPDQVIALLRGTATPVQGQSAKRAAATGSAGAVDAGAALDALDALKGLDPSETGIWHEVDGNLRYFFQVDYSLATDWQLIDDAWYYFDSKGNLKTGWQTIQGSRYYLDPETGALHTGWEKLDGAWYYLDPETGAMQTGWVKLDGAWYYLDSASGVMRTGWLDDSGHRYFLKSSGAMATGWLKVSGYWYYFKSSGAMHKGWLKKSGKYYYLKKSNGRMLLGAHKVDGYWRYFNKSGVLHKGWLKKSGKYYYFTKSNGRMLTGWHKIGSTYRYFNSKGVLQRSTWIGNRWVNSRGIWTLSC